MSDKVVEEDSSSVTTPNNVCFYHICLWIPEIIGDSKNAIHFCSIYFLNFYYRKDVCHHLPVNRYSKESAL